MVDPKKQAEEKLEDTSEDRKQEILDSFQGFLDYLNKQVNRGEKLGLGEEQLAKGAERVAEHLKNHEEPQNSEEKLLQELWKVAEDEEKRHIARALVRLAQQEGNA
ncbi:DUF3243 family protein [Alkalicoccus daliensis]|uniref:DUF3243 domain-containing protein n=1 Tax=Alkalicoccus daliensis TaxID=745820 RepID=A0A1H0JNR5_9BACI|nr:DUF3243 family protein [Alkalicoccus daliensis]SDO45356.1 Protein of unknown function [Alkalicoccus daliensis]